MRLRLWRRRLTISSPRMAIRTGLPWPLGWLLAAVVLGLSGALALWAFEFGREMAGLEPFDKQTLNLLREENERLRNQLSIASNVANTAESLLTVERAAQISLLKQMEKLQTDNQTLKIDLGFFEQLLKPSDGSSVSIRSLQAIQTAPTFVTWRAVLVQAAKTPTTFNGGLEVTFRGSLKGSSWALTLPSAKQPIALTQFQMMEGRLNPPPGVVINNISIRVMQGMTVKSVMSARVNG